MILSNAYKGKRMRSSKAIMSAFVAVAWIAGSAWAQTANVYPPPVYVQEDANGVDLITGAFSEMDPGPNIGANGKELSRDYWINGLDNNFGYIQVIPFTVAVGKHSDAFVGGSGGTFVSATLDGATWTPATASYTDRDGAVAAFAPDGGTYYWPFDLPTIAFGTRSPDHLASITRPDGEVLTYNWVPNATAGVNLLQSIVSNTGYGIYYQWTVPTVTLASVTLVNGSMSYCSPIANGCTGSTQTWPSATYSNPASSPFVVTDALGRQTSYSSTAITNEKITRPSGVFKNLTFDANQRVTSVTNGTGTWHYTWAYQYPYNPTNYIQQVTVTDPLGHTRVVVSQAQGGAGTFARVISDTDALGHKAGYTYDTAGRMTSVTFPEGNSRSYQYDGRGNITQETQTEKPSLGTATIVTSANYDATCTSAVKCNKPNWVKDANGNVTYYTYSAVHGEILTETKPAAPNGVQPVTAHSYAQIPTYTLNSSGVMVQVGSLWRQTGTTACATTTATIAATTTSASVSCAGGAADLMVRTVSYTGSNNAQATSVTEAAGDGSLSATTTTTYDAVGNVLSTTSAVGATTLNIYDAARQLVGVIGPDPDGAGPLLNRAVRNTYTPDGLLTLMETGTVTGQSLGAWPSFSALKQDSILYDSVDRKSRDSVISGGSTQMIAQYTYDTANRLTCTAVRMNPGAFGSLPTSACTLGTAGSYGPDRVTYNSYFNDDRLQQVTEGYGTSVQRNERTLGYSPNGQLVTQNDANGNLTVNTYDGFDRLQYVYYPSPVNGATYSTTDYEQYTYDNVGNITQDRRRDGQINVKGYDALNRLGSTTLPTPTSYTYDNLDRRSTAARGGQTLTFGYDALNHQTSETGAYGTFGYQYNLVGDLIRITWPDNFYAVYTYDLYDEVTQIGENGATSGAGLLARYSYNNLGKRSALMRGNGVSTSYGYDAAWRLSSLSHSFPAGAANQNITLAYNPANQIVNRGSTNLSYDYQASAQSVSYTVNGQNELTKVGGATVTYDGRGNLSSDSSNSYGYDADNNLTSFNSTATLKSDPAGRLMAVTDLSGGTATTGSRWFRYDGVNLLAEYGMVGSDNGVLHRRYVPGLGTDEPVVWYDSADTSLRRWLVPDERGSIIAVADVNGATLATNTYDEYGVPGANNQGRFQYTGQIWIPEVGLYHYKARDYSPTLGRFVQTDPAGFADDLDLYAYVGDDPVDHGDPSGLANCPTPNLGNGSDVCVETPESAQNPGTPPPQSEPTQKLQEVVVTAQREKKDSGGKPISFVDRKEHPYVVTPNSISPAPIKPLGDVSCGNGISVQVNGVSATAGSTIAHTHPDSFGAPGSVPGPGDGRAARSSSAATAFVMTSHNVFTIEAFSNGTFRTTVSGGPLSDSQRNALIASMQNWENPAANAPGGNDKQKYCGKQ